MTLFIITLLLTLILFYFNFEGCKNTRNGEHKTTETDETIQENRRRQQFVRDSTSNNREVYKKCNTTPLHISSSKGFSHIVKDLIAKGANVNLCDDEGLSPLYLACFSEHTETVKILLGHRADVNNPSPLCIMCEFGNAEIVRMLLNNGANVNLCNYEGLSPLFVACYNEHTEIIKILLEHGADVNKASPLCIMCKLGNSEIVRILLNNGANVNLCDDKGRSPLFLACYSNHNEIVKILLDNDADVNISSPFRIRNAFRNAEIVQILITNGADVSLCNDDDKDLYI